ncbi:GATA zinc finger domain-containing protein 14-like [Cydia pomonella]|uniref:GATA zinc finger domain-containing protein 14-like n=1 Tax=Cydia pomonella TaxID=82600 RepID=UPI002ADDE854|nr:GATA zinc finger domain-containing protein 14-like [Cydia pomonella]
MQLILETEASVDLKTKMSLTDNVEKAVSDILSGVQNNEKEENNEAVKETNISNVHKIDQINKAAPIDTDKDIEKNGDATISENDIDTSNDCNTTNNSNGNNSSNKEVIENIEGLAQPHAEKNVKCENTTIEENHIGHDSKSNETEANCDGATNGLNEHMSEINMDAIEPVDTVCNNIETEATNIEASRDEGINKNSHPCDIENINQDIIDNTESVTDESSNNIDSNINLNEEVNIKQEITGNTESVTDESSNNIDSTINLDEEVNIDSNINLHEEVDNKQDDKETPISDDMNTDVCEDSLIKKEIEDTSSQENNSKLNSISDKTVDIPAQSELDDSDLKLSHIETEIPENAPASEEKETMETDNAKDDDDASEEHIDFIRSEASDNCDKMNDADITDEAEKEALSTNNAEENDSLNTNDVISMDVDANMTACDEDKNEIDSIITPVSATEIIKSNVKTNLPIKQNVSQLDDNKNSDKEIVNLDDDKDKNNEPEVVETESTVTKADDDEPILNCDDQTEVTDNVEKSLNEEQMSVDDIIDLDEPKESQDSPDEKRKDEKENINKAASENDKPVEPVLKLSNTLDILSDDEEDQAPKSSNTDNSDNKCINIEDDDDIMLIDDDTSGNESKNEPIKEQEVEKQIESKPASPAESEKLTEDSKSIDKVEDDVVEKDAPVPDKEVTVSTTSPDISEKTEENMLEAEIKKPLVPENFLKTCKKNLVDMTRDELEEFCILKIVESILDRSNLSEIKNKLKTLTQNLEEYKKKAMMLQKQNRDLQVVFKSVQEDVKKASDAPIVPLKITRSVGMQVLMSDKTDKRRRPGIGMPNNFVNNNNKQVRNPVAQGPRPQKPPTQPIPVPRLVPASPAKNSPQQQVNPNKVTSPLPNGVKSVSPVQKGEKRTHNRMQSVTVDLTDDEPPTKMVNRTGPMPPVRLVPSQNLLAAPRTPGVNSPRKVYIPISGPQGQNVRPGQTIMLKTVPTPGPRQRTAPPHMVRMPQGAMRMNRPQGLRHPAPLPECMKQYQPPNWKALPPAPDLKLAKVENGIVISWKIEGYQEDSYEEIASYQLYAYQETTSPPSTALWKKIGDVKALPLPMACTLTQFMAGYKYYFAVRAVDIRSRLGPFSLPGSILLLNKM